MKVKKHVISVTLFIIFLTLFILYANDHNIKYHQPSIVKKEENKILKEDPKIKEIQNLYEKNHDLVGWIQIEDTEINYPIMYTQNDDYYLRRDFYKNDYESGSIFIDKHNQLNPRDLNIIIHGHNMKDGYMFYDLTKYKDPNFYETHKKIILYTLEKKEEYEIIAVFLSKIYHVIDNNFKYYYSYQLKTEEEYYDYIDNIKKNSLYPIALSAHFPESLITLSTCEYSQENGRMVVVAKKLETN